MFLTIVVLAALLIVALFCLFLLWSRVSTLKSDLLGSRKEYRALEEGRDEDQENYEQIYLSQAEELDGWVGKYNTLVETARIIEDIARYHDNHCIPDYAPRLSQEERLAIGW